MLTDKIILIITPQSWGKMLLAKHHYAIELAKKGNEVYYLNPPDNHYWRWGKERIQIKPILGISGLFVIEQQLYFPYSLKFHSRKIYNKLIKRQIRNIVHKIPKQIDIIWSFDLGNLFPLSFFDNKYFKIFHPVDEPGDDHAILAAKGARIIFSVTKEILEKYKSTGIPAYFINHGLSNDFLNQLPTSSNDQHIKVGLSGNFLRPDLDREKLIQIIKENQNVIFHFYGSYLAPDSNIGAKEDKQTEIFIETLKSFNNVEFHGVLDSQGLAKELNRMDALLICYDIQLDQSGGTNYHKVMEYLSTGKVIISNNITTYQGHPDLICMTTDRENNALLPELFRKIISELETWNSEMLMKSRQSFAHSNTYDEQLGRIEKFICELNNC